MRRKAKKVFVINMPSVVGNTVMNVRRVRRHAHIWKEYPMGLICKGCGERRGAGVSSVL